MLFLLKKEYSNSLPVGRQANSNNGFTLIETMVAVVILSVALVGPLTIITKGLNSAFFSRDQITAFYLAQEAVEYVRNRRDQNTIQGLTWLDGLEPVCTGVNPCLIDVTGDYTLPTPTDIVECATGTCPIMRYDGNFYNYDSGGVATPFTREVRLTSVSVVEYIVSVNISWRTGTFARSFFVKEYMFNWQLGS